MLLYKPKLHVLSSKYYCFRLIYGGKAEAAVSKLGNGSNVDLPFAMFSHQYESKAIKLYYSMSTISYTPKFSYLFNMTLIECSRILKHRPFAWRSDSGPTAMTARSFQHPGLRAS